MGGDSLGFLGERIFEVEMIEMLSLGLCLREMVWRPFLSLFVQGFLERSFLVRILRVVGQIKPVLKCVKSEVISE